MLAYLANRPVKAAREPSPNALLLVICVHVALLAAVMSAKMDLPSRVFDPPPKLIPITLPKDPRPIPLPPHPSTQPRPTHDLQPLPVDPILVTDPSVDPGIIVGGGTGGTSTSPTTASAPVRHAPRLLTSPAELRPPYPLSKLLTGDEAILRVKLTIDERGRVVAVDPVGRADRVFLETARRYLIAHWRYQPATDDGRAIQSSLVINLQFELDG
jgi:periplasmic protein TonB